MLDAILHDPDHRMVSESLFGTASPPTKSGARQVRVGAFEGDLLVYPITGTSAGGPIADAKNLLPILLRDRVRPAVEWSVRSASANAGFEELPLRTGPFEALHCGGVDFAVMVVGRLEPNDHVPLCFVVANARNVTALFNVLTRKGVK
jgi:hypothetical protein